MATSVIAFPQAALPIGVTTSPAVTPPVGTHQVMASIGCAAFLDPATSVDAAIEVSFDAGVTFQHLCSAVWIGGTQFDKNGVTTNLGWLASLGTIGGTPVVTDANTRFRLVVTIAGGTVTLGPGTITLS